MRDSEKKICDDVLRYGKILRDEEFVCEGIMVREYTIAYEGEKYDLVKNNGEWVSFHRN